MTDLMPTINVRTVLREFQQFYFDASARPKHGGEWRSIGHWNEDGTLTLYAQQGEALTAYDAGLLNDFGGGNVEWWQDYIRAELGRAHDFYESQIATPKAEPAGWRQTPYGPAQSMESLLQEEALTDALRMAVRQNSHDMLMTGEEIRQCEAALAALERPEHPVGSALTGRAAIIDAWNDLPPYIRQSPAVQALYDAVRNCDDATPSRAPESLDPHPPSRHCMCADCEPSFRDESDPAAVNEPHPPWCSGGCCNPGDEPVTSPERRIPATRSPAAVSDEQINAALDSIKAEWWDVPMGATVEFARSVLALAAQPAVAPSDSKDAGKS